MQLEQTGANIWIYNGVVVQLYSVIVSHGECVMGNGTNNGH